MLLRFIYFFVFVAEIELYSYRVCVCGECMWAVRCMIIV